LKGITLDYFEPYLANNPVNEPVWLSNYKLYVEELLINFGPYNMMADAEIELEQLVMKDSHKATKFFVDFTNSPHFLNTMTKHSTEGHTLLFQRGSRTRWYTSTNLAHSIDSGTSFRKSTSAIGNVNLKSHERSPSLPGRKSRTISQTSPTKILVVRIRLARLR